MPTPMQLTVFRALANRRRLQLLELLSKHDELSLTAAASAIKLSVKSTHKHLTQLMQAGFLASNRRGLLAYYWVEPQHKLAHSLLQLIRR